MIAFDQIRRLSSNSSMMFGHCITNANSCDIFIFKQKNESHSHNISMYTFYSREMLTLAITQLI